MTRQRIAAQTATEFAAFAAHFFEEFCPEQQINRDFVVDVICERAGRTQCFDIHAAAIAWLCE